MDENGIVSVWVGKVKDEDFIDKYVDCEYTDDGESKPSKFFKDFVIDIDDIDEDFIEKAVYKTNSNNLSALLEGCSYSEIVIKNICKLEEGNFDNGYNAVILVYNYKYSGRKNVIKRIGYKMAFLNSVSYLK